MAASLGIDLGNPEDLFAGMVKIGIDDLDPTRVLRDCRHLFLTLSRHSPGFFQLSIAHQLQLPTMGAKVLHCALHKYTREGTTLDGVYSEFRTDYCSQCPDRIPRAGDWQYSHQWQLAENERNQEFMSGPRRPTRRPLPPPPPPPHLWQAGQDADTPGGKRAMTLFQGAERRTLTHQRTVDSPFTVLSTFTGWLPPRIFFTPRWLMVKPSAWSFSAIHVSSERAL
jgi:hypothetical protein